MDIIQIIETVTQNQLFLKYGLLGLFLNGLLSSVIPIPTEVTTSALLAGGEDGQTVFIVLTISSITGGFLAYYLGRTGNKIFKYFHKSPKKQDEERSRGLLLKYGWLAIFFCSWIPILGDVIPIVAGAKKYNFERFAIAMSAGKAVKALVIIYFSSLIATKFLQK
jgi:membrane protein YqaA with SNARE-associated domain